MPPSFHLEARDMYVAHMADGADVQRQRLKELLESVAMLRSAADVESQLQNGTVVQIDTVRSLHIISPSFLSLWSGIYRITLAMIGASQAEFWPLLCFLWVPAGLNCIARKSTKADTIYNKPTVLNY